MWSREQIAVLQTSFQHYDTLGSTSMVENEIEERLNVSLCHRSREKSFYELMASELCGMW